jgi:hypothetical protein
MLNPEDRAAWEDAFHAAQQPTAEVKDEPGSWYGTVILVAAGLLLVWALYAWLPAR